MRAGALGCSISGAGPTVFAWSRAEHANAVESAMIAAFGASNVAVDHWVIPIESTGARVLES
jgi:homoserine kinase